MGSFVGQYINERGRPIVVGRAGPHAVAVNISGSKMDGRWGGTVARVSNDGSRISLFNLTGTLLTDGSISWSNSRRWPKQDAASAADGALPSDYYHPCRHDNRQMLGDFTIMPAAPRGLSPDDLRARKAASFRRHRLRAPVWHERLEDVPGRLAVATVIGRTSSPRYQDSRPNADQLPCAIVMQFLSLRDIGGIPFSRAGENGKFEYVVIVSDNGTATEDELFGAYGLRVVRAPMPPRERYPEPFERGAMMKAHGIGLSEYSRVLLLDGDMFAQQNLLDHFRVEFAEGLVTSEHSSSPCAGNWMMLRPSRAVYDAVMPVATERRFSYATGWNDSGLFTWPPTNDLPCEPPGWAHQPPNCKPNALWVARCARYRLTNWIWMGASEVQGFFPWIYNVSGLGTMRTLPSGWIPPKAAAAAAATATAAAGAAATGSGNDCKGGCKKKSAAASKSPPRSMPLGQGAPWWAHFQGGTKPWIMDNPHPDICPGEKFHKPAEWFWREFWPTVAALEGGVLTQQCPSFARARPKYFEFGHCK